MRHGLTVEQTSTSMHGWMAGVSELSDRDLQAISGIYDASLIDLDAATADLMDELEARGVLEDTVVVLTSDHGEALGEHGLMLHKYSVYQELAHVPFVMWVPGRPPACPA